MNSHDFDNVEAEKDEAIRKFNRIQRLTEFMRSIEVFIALVLISWLSTHLPIVKRVSGEVLLEITFLLPSTRFIFFVGNLIVVTLIAQSSGKNSCRSKIGEKIYEYIKTNECRSIIVSGTDISSSEQNQIQDEQIVSLESGITPENERTVTALVSVTTETEKSPELKYYRRSQSEDFERETQDKNPIELRRSVTESCPRDMVSVEEAVRQSCAIEDLSNEEFKRTIEAFIERQRKFQRDESMAIVVMDQ